MTIRQTRHFLVFVMIAMILAALLQVGVLIFGHGPKSGSLFIGSPLLFTVVFASQLRRLREREAIEGPDAPFSTTGRSRKALLIVVAIGLLAVAVGLTLVLTLHSHA